jgi:hypothetical protein
VKVKLQTNANVPPSIFLSYGSYGLPKTGISNYYRLSIFDTKTTDIRLYDHDGSVVTQSYLQEEPDLTKEIVITLSPSLLKESGQKVLINVSIDYSSNFTGKAVRWTSDEDFIVTFPTVSLESVSNQFGLGVPKGACFKPIFTEFQK